MKQKTVKPLLTITLTGIRYRNMKLVFIIAILFITSVKCINAGEAIAGSQDTESLKTLEHSIQLLGTQLYNSRRNDKKSEELSIQITLRNNFV